MEVRGDMSESRRGKDKGQEGPLKGMDEMGDTTEGEGGIHEGREGPRKVMERRREE